MAEQPNVNEKKAEKEGSELGVRQGAFMESLKRNNRKIRDDRAESIAEDAELIFKREVENLNVAIRRMKRKRENMLDMSPENALTLKMGKDFDPDVFVEADLKLGVDIRNAEIKLDIATERYNYLFGGN